MSQEWELVLTSGQLLGYWDSKDINKPRTVVLKIWWEFIRSRSGIGHSSPREALGGKGRRVGVFMCMCVSACVSVHMCECMCMCVCECAGHVVVVLGCRYWETLMCACGTELNRGEAGRLGEQKISLKIRTVFFSNTIHIERVIIWSSKKVHSCKLLRSLSWLLPAG